MEFNNQYILERAELFFSSLHEMQSYLESAEKFTCKVLLNPSDPKHLEFIKAVHKLATGVKISKSNLNSRTCIKHDEYQGKEQVVFSSSNRDKIVFVNQEGKVFEPTKENTPFKRGCIVNVMVSFWHQKDHQTRVNANVHCIRFVDVGKSDMYNKSVTEDDIARMCQPLTPAIGDVVDVDCEEVPEVKELNGSCQVALDYD